MAWTGENQHCRRKYDYVCREAGVGSAGVGFMINNDTSKTVLGYNQVSELVTTLRVNAKPVNITFVHVNAPTCASSEEDITAYYDNLNGYCTTYAEIMLLRSRGTGMQISVNSCVRVTT